MTTENPYWTACRKALGREPENLEFMSWITKQWAAYRKEKGIREGHPPTDEERAGFWAWLQR